ncbi:MAG: hypothetical protein KAQ68_08310, partial [Clostridiales bacterium]|nr:hypothetical protein [Clostridiales bacterium]
KLLSHHINEMGKVIIDTPAGPTRTMAPQPEEYYKELNLPEVVNDLSELYENLVNVIGGIEELIINHQTVRRTMLLIEAVFESAKNNIVVKTNI